MASVAEATLRRCATEGWPFLALPKDSKDLRDYRETINRAGANINALKERRGKKDVIDGRKVKSLVKKLDDK